MIYSVRHWRQRYMGKHMALSSVITKNRNKWKQIIRQCNKYYITDKHKVVREHSNRMINSVWKEKLGE